MAGQLNSHLTGFDIPYLDFASFHSCCSHRAVRTQRESLKTGAFALDYPLSFAAGRIPDLNCSVIARAYDSSSVGMKCRQGEPARMLGIGKQLLAGLCIPN